MEFRVNKKIIALVATLGLSTMALGGNLYPHDPLRRLLCKTRILTAVKDCAPYTSRRNLQATTPTDDPFLQKLTVTNKFTYNTQCSYGGGNYSATFKGSSGNYDVVIGPDVRNNTIEYTYPILGTTGDRAQPKYLIWNISFDPSLYIFPYDCDMKTISNISRINLQPLEAITSYIGETILADYNIKDSLLSLQVLPSAWGSLEARIAELDQRIEIEELNLELETDEMKKFDIEERIDWYQDLRVNLMNALDIAAQCSMDTDAICLAMAKTIHDQIDASILEKKNKVESYIAFLDLELARATAIAEEYKEKIAQIINKLEIAKTIGDDMDGGDGDGNGDDMDMDIPSMVDLGEDMEMNTSNPMTPDMMTMLDERAIPVTMTCSWASRPYAYQLMDAVAFVNIAKDNVNIFSYEMVTDQGCQTVDMTDTALLKDLKANNHVRNLADFGINQQMRKNLSGEDDPFWEIVRNHSRRITQSCNWASRPRIYQFRDFIAYLDSGRTNFNIFSYDTVLSKNCVIPSLD